MSQTPEALNLEQAIAVLRRRLALIVLCAVVVGGAAFAYSARQPKKYTATASLAFTTNPVSEQIAGLQAQPQTCWHSRRATWNSCASATWPRARRASSGTA